MVSFDVVSLFTAIPADKNILMKFILSWKKHALNSFHDLLNAIDPHIKFTVEEHDGWLFWTLKSHASMDLWLQTFIVNLHKLFRQHLASYDEL